MRQQELPRGRKRRVRAGDRIVGVHEARKANQRAAEPVTNFLSAVPAGGGQRVRVVAMAGRIEHVKVDGVDVFVRTVPPKRHDHVGEDPDPVLVERPHEGHQVAVSRRRSVLFRKSEIEIRREEIRGRVSPLP